MPTMIFLYDASMLEWFINPVKNLNSKGLVAIVCWYVCILFVCSIFIFLPLECHGGTIFWTNPDSLRSCPFQSFSDFL